MYCQVVNESTCQEIAIKIVKKKEMGTVIYFEDLEIWKSSRVLAREVYADFKKNTDVGFKNQIQRCAVSVMNNIAEGFSRKGDRELHQFLNIARASCGELKSMYYLSEDIDYVNREIAIQRRASATKLMNGIAKLMKYLRKE